MLHKNVFIVIVLFLALFNSTLLAKGVKITLHLKNGEQRRGELYSVSDSTLIIGVSNTGRDRFAEIEFAEIRHAVADKKPDLLLLLQSDQQINGKLYAVSDSSMFVESRDATQIRVRSDFGKHIVEVKNREVKVAMVKLKGRSNSIGAGLGLFAGTIAGAVVGTHLLTRHKHNPIEFIADMIASGWIMVGAPIGGAIAGSKIGATPGREGESEAMQPYAVLKPLARYSSN